jgi:hypothetical protein
VNWEGLNHELRHTNWDALLNCTEPEIGWKKFKENFSLPRTNLLRNALSKPMAKIHGLILGSAMMLGKRKCGSIKISTRAIGPKLPSHSPEKISKM